MREDIVALEGEVGDSSNDSLGPAEMEGIEHEDDEREEFVFDSQRAFSSPAGINYPTTAMAYI